jgi:beta-mannosidase
MGSLYWQLNDVWQVASWSGIDCFGRWKALHYYAREAFSPVAALPIMDGEILKIYGVNDKPDTAHLTLHVHAHTFEGKTLSDVTQIDTHITPDSSRMIWQGTLKSVLNKHKPENAVVEIVLKDSSSNIVYRRLYYPVPPKKMTLPKPDTEQKVEQINEGYAITLSADRLAKNVCISTEVNGSFSDNYFDLLAGEKKTIIFRTERILEDPKTAFKIRSLADTME